MDKYPRREGRAKVYEMLSYQNLYPNNLSDVPLSKEIVKGDLVIFTPADRYRNEGVTIFDGRRLIHLQFWPDDYGNLPSIFTPLEDGAPLDYWHALDIIQHNDIIWLKLTTIRDSNFKYTIDENIDTSLDPIPISLSSIRLK